MAENFSSESRLDPIAVTVDEACRVMGIGRTTLYELLQGGEVRGFSVGRRRLVSVASIREWEARSLAREGAA